MHGTSLISTACITVAIALTTAASARGDLIHDESIHGDLSGNQAAPTHYTLLPGSNTLIATSVSGDREYVRLSVPAGLLLDSLILVDYAGIDGTAFIAVQQGTEFTEPPTGTNVANLLGWSHFGPGVGNVGLDILPGIGSGLGAMGFTPPLAAGEYTWWIQQTGGNAATYELDFVVTPEPTSLALLGLVATVLLRRRR